jgi:hypothetical protein
MSSPAWLERADRYWSDDLLNDDRTVELDRRRDGLDAEWSKPGKKETARRCSDRTSGGRERYSYGGSPCTPMPLEVPGGMLRIKAIHCDRYLPSPKMWKLIFLQFDSARQNVNDLMIIEGKITLNDVAKKELDWSEEGRRPLPGLRTRNDQCQYSASVAPNFSFWTELLGV